MAVLTNNLRRLVVLYWRHSQEDRENSWTKELYEKLIYDDDLRLRYQNKTEFIFANVNRRTESYLQNRDIIYELRRHKERYHPLVYLDLIFPNQDGSREELYSICNEHDIRQVMKRIRYYMLEYQR
jgi:hypothetical protein